MNQEMKFYRKRAEMLLQFYFKKHKKINTVMVKNLRESKYLYQKINRQSNKI